MAAKFVNQWDIHPLLDEHGNITHWVSYQHDVTERKRAELSVLNTNADTEELYEDSPKRTIVDLAEKQVRWSEPTKPSGKDDRLP